MRQADSFGSERARDRCGERSAEEQTTIAMAIRSVHTSFCAITQPVRNIDRKGRFNALRAWQAKSGTRKRAVADPQTGPPAATKIGWSNID